jgi:mono/diheme cytochrome c family protein
MKKLTIILALGVAIAACSRKTVATAETKPEVETTTVTESSLALQGKTVYTNRCGRCHGLKNTQRYTVSEWDNILKSMIPKARLNEEQASQVTAYVHANAKKG